MKKKYGDGYEDKLKRIMQRLGVDSFHYDWTRTDCYIAFFYHGQEYRFEHSLEKARASGQSIGWVSDCFAQLVLTIEDLARMTERGIYTFDKWIEGMKALPAPAPAPPDCFVGLGFRELPDRPALAARYKQLAKAMHPDTGGDTLGFVDLKANYDKCVAWLDARGGDAGVQ